MLRAVPETTRKPASSVVEFKSFILSLTISSTCLRVTLPTLSLFGSFDPAVMRCYPISSRNNHVANDDAECAALVEVAQDQARQASEDHDCAGRDQEREHAAGAHRLRHRRIESRRIGGRRKGGQRIGIEQVKCVQQTEPGFHRENGEVGGVIEEGLRPAVVHDKRVVDHHEIHVGVTPVNHGIPEQKKRQRKAGDDPHKSGLPAEKGQPVEGITRRAG